MLGNLFTTDCIPSPLFFDRKSQVDSVGFDIKLANTVYMLVISYCLAAAPHAQVGYKLSEGIKKA